MVIEYPQPRQEENWDLLESEILLIIRNSILNFSFTPLRIANNLLSANLSLMPIFKNHKIFFFSRSREFRRKEPEHGFQFKKKYLQAYSLPSNTLFTFFSHPLIYIYKKTYKRKETVNHFYSKNDRYRKMSLKRGQLGILLQILLSIKHSPTYPGWYILYPTSRPHTPFHLVLANTRKCFIIHIS